MSVKKYSPRDGEWGAVGEAALCNYIRSCGYQADKHPDGIYGLDIEFSSPVERFYVDVERRKTGWSGDAWFPFQTLHVLSRRPVRIGVMFFTMSADMTRAYVSFPEDLELVKPEPMNNRHVQGEMIRDHEIMRCLPLDLTKPIEGSLARMNANRVRNLVRDGKKYSEIVRALRGNGKCHFGSPYGICDEEWREMNLAVERHAGLRACTSRNPQLGLFGGKVTT
jgi:hypothetical protein